MSRSDIDQKFLDEINNSRYPVVDISEAATQMAAGTEPPGATPMTLGQFATSAADVPAGLLKGAVQGSIGLPGDIISLARGLYDLGASGGDLDAFLAGMEKPTGLPTTEDMKKFFDETLGVPLIPKGAEQLRAGAAKTPEFVGELFGGGKTAVELAKGAAKGINVGSMAVADRAVQAITGNPQATAMGVLEEAGQMSPLANVMPGASQIKIAPDLSIGVAPKLESQNFKTWFGDWQANPEDASKVVDDGGAPIVVYHGTQRPDRIGTQFRKSRATSGPMAFFTDRPELASSYATGKKDTSLEYENTDYANWFKKKEGRSKLNLDQVGARMSSQERQEVLDKLRLVGQDDQGNIVIGEPLVSDQTFDFMLKDPREAGGNPLKLANKLWLESGTLFGREEEFSKVLDAIGIKGFEQDFPTSSYPAIYPVYLSIKNPLDTSQIDQRTMYALEYNAKRQRKPRGSGGSDLWDKRMRDPKEWIGQLKEDMAEGKSSMVWTSIPDWVTATLKAEGYDGIKDVGGKRGGTSHTVWIPFDENQVKSATGNIGTYSLESKNILRGGVAGAVGATGAATMQDNEERM